MTRISRILAAVSAGLVVCFAACGSQSVSLSWSASTNSATVGYILYAGTASHVYTSQINVGANTVITLSGLTGGQKYYFAVAGYNAAGTVGALSAEASFVAPTNTSPAPGWMTSVIVSPASGPPGTSVYLYGGLLTGATSVSFNGSSAAFSAVSNGVLAATVPPGATTGPLNIITPNGTITSQFTVTAVPSPANDDFANGQALTGTTALAWADTTYATKEPGEPNHGGNSGGASVWYSWVPPATGSYILDTHGSSFDTLLAVYTGANLAGLSVVASNTAPADGPLNFQATAGTQYRIAVDGFNGARGPMQLRLSQISNPTTIFADTFEAAEGVVAGSPLAGQNGWLCSVPALSGVASGLFPGDGQQGFLGFANVSLASNTVLLYHPLNYTMNTNTLPIVQFSVLFEILDPLDSFHDSFGWVFRDTAGHPLFNLVFNNATGQITYGLDDGAGQRLSGIFYPGQMYQLEISADFSRNNWVAVLNGETIAGAPISTIQTAPKLGDIDAEAIYPALTTGDDGMVFDNFTVSAEPEAIPSILQGPQNQVVTGGSDVVLGVTASGEAPLSYQWYFNATPVAGATNASLWLTNTVPAESGAYWVTVSNAAGEDSTGCMVTIASVQAKAALANPASLGQKGQFLTFNVATGNSYRVQASTNLAAWSTLGSFYANGSTATFLDGAASSYPHRFYRLVSP